MLLQGKVAIITGAASERGIGRATAVTFAQHGARVVILDLDEAAARDAAAALGEGHLGLAANVADESQVKQAVAKIIEHFGRIDVLVNNAGITQPIKTLDIRPGDYDKVLDVSLRGTLLMSQGSFRPCARRARAASCACLRYPRSVAAASSAARITALQKPAYSVWARPWRGSSARTRFVSTPSRRA